MCACAEAGAALARLATVDPDTLPPDLRTEYEQQCAGWEYLRTLTEDEAVALQVETCEHAGRELTPDEMRGLLRRQ